MKPKISTRPLGLILELQVGAPPKLKKFVEGVTKQKNLRIQKIGKSVSYIRLGHPKPDLVSGKTWKMLCRRLKKYKGIRSCLFDQRLAMTTRSDAVPVNARDTTQGRENPLRGSEELRSPSECNLFREAGDPSINYEGRSDFWAQEAVGADLVDEAFDALIKSRRRPTTVNSYVCDNFFGSHGPDVSSIVDGDSDQSESKAKMCTQAGSVWDLVDEINNSDFRDQTSLVNYSMGPVDHFTAENFPDTEEMENIIWVASAGNEGGAQFEAARSIQSAAADGKILLVGSLSPLGLPSDFSSYSPEVLISAPSDDSITACRAKNRCRAFGGTSGAAPQVSHVVKKTLSLLPQLSKRQLESLILKTAIPTPNFYDDPNLNGKGMLNSYKLWRVAQRLEQECRIASDTSQCIDQKIATSLTFAFDSSETKRSLSQSFPECHKGGRSRQKVLCSDRSKAFRKLRQAAFLDPHNRELWRVVSCVQGRSGNLVSLNFYNNIGRDPKEQPFSRTQLYNESDQNPFERQVRNSRYLLANEKRAVASEFQNQVQNKIRRGGRIGSKDILLASDLGLEGLDFLIETAGGARLRREALSAIERQGAEAIPALVARFDSFTNDQKREFGDVAAKLKDQGLPYLRVMARKGSSTLRGRLVDWTRKLSDDNAVSLLENLLRDPKHQRRAIEVLATRNQPGFKALSGVDAITLDLSSQMAYFDALVQFGRASSPVLVSQLRRIDDPAIKRNIVSVAWDLGQDAGPVLAEALKSSSQDVVLEAVRTAAGVSGSTGRQVLNAAKSSRDPEVRRQAIEALGRLR